MQRSCLPSVGQMIGEQIGSNVPAGSEVAVRERCAADL